MRSLCCLIIENQMLIFEMPVSVMKKLDLCSKKVADLQKVIMGRISPGKKCAEQFLPRFVRTCEEQLE